MRFELDLVLSLKYLLFRIGGRCHLQHIQLIARYKSLHEKLKNERIASAHCLEAMDATKCEMASVRRKYDELKALNEDLSAKHDRSCSVITELDSNYLSQSAVARKRIESLKDEIAEMKAEHALNEEAYTQCLEKCKSLQDDVQCLESKLIEIVLIHNVETKDLHKDYELRFRIHRANEAKEHEAKMSDLEAANSGMRRQYECALNEVDALCPCLMRHDFQWFLVCSLTSEWSLAVDRGAKEQKVGIEGAVSFESTG